MALIKKGDPSLQLQPGWSLETDYDQVIRGTSVYEGDAGRPGPVKFHRHPYDSRAVCIAVKETKMKTEKKQWTCQYLGLEQSPTIGIVEFPGGTGQDPIETHPKFAQFAGTSGKPQNGAIFDDTTGEFIGFGAGSFAGVRSYLVPNVAVNVTWWQSTVPAIGRIGKRVSGVIPNFYPPAGAQDKLLVGMPYRQYGPFFQVTASVLCGERWNSSIYS